MLRARQRLGKYRVDRRIGVGGFAVVYKAYDTIEGIPVALKVPHAPLLTKEALDNLRKEVRVTAQLDHPSILPIKNASFIGKLLVIVTALGEGTLGDRLKKRLTVRTALTYAEQMIAAVANAHERRIIHCDVKPDNFILFPGDKLRLSDFGIAKVAQRTRTLYASGTGTVGYIAPEQALGKPSFRSDVFSLGLVIYRMLSGTLPEWPYDWPLPGYDRLRQAVPIPFVDFILRAIEVDERQRYRDAIQMHAAFQRLKPRTLQYIGKKRARRGNGRTYRHWKTVRWKQFRRQYGRKLDVRHECKYCGGPIGETMRYCPWCGRDHKVYDGPSSFPDRCERCGRGRKLDWKYCAWCYGPGAEVSTSRTYGDKRYEAKCANSRCQKKQLMPYMRYCPWCNVKVRRPWKIPDNKDKCRRCGWGVIREYWDHCPWCGRQQAKT